MKNHNKLSSYEGWIKAFIVLVDIFRIHYLMISIGYDVFLEAKKLESKVPGLKEAHLHIHWATIGAFAEYSKNNPQATYKDLQAFYNFFSQKEIVELAETVQDKIAADFECEVFKDTPLHTFTHQRKGFDIIRRNSAKGIIQQFR